MTPDVGTATWNGKGLQPIEDLSGSSAPVLHGRRGTSRASRVRGEGGAQGRMSNRQGRGRVGAAAQCRAGDTAAKGLLFRRRYNAWQQALIAHRCRVGIDPNSRFAKKNRRPRGRRETAAASPSGRLGMPVQPLCQCLTTRKGQRNLELGVVEGAGRSTCSGPAIGRRFPRHQGCHCQGSAIQASGARSTERTAEFGRCFSKRGKRWPDRMPCHAHRRAHGVSSMHQQLTSLPALASRLHCALHGKQWSTHHGHRTTLEC